MHLHLVRSFSVTLALLAAGPATARGARTARAAAAPPAAPASPYCSGEYADDLAALSATARDFEQRQQPYTYCVRSTAVYECPSYAPDGTLRRTRRKVVAHGTGFGVREQAGETLVVTNDHVTEWPAVTDEEHAVEDVPAGCRRVSTALRVVDDEADTYERDDVPLSRVVTDSQLDVSILRAKAALPVMPWKIGRSSALRERNVVDVRGFPLGALRANNVGKVVSTYDHDESNDWNHDDFVVDALLSPGNSGSPVFAVSCRTRELELVGIYHARYATGSALHVVIGIDQIRDLLTTLKRSPRQRSEAANLDGAARERLASAAAAASVEPFFPFGGLVAAVRTRADGALVFELMAKDFPVQPHAALVIEDLPGAGGAEFGRLSRLWAGNRQGLREVDPSTLDADGKAHVSRLLEALRRDALAAFAYRTAAARSIGSREQFQEVKSAERTLQRTAEARQDIAQNALELSEQLCPRSADASGTLADALRVPQPASRVAAGAPVPAWDGWRPALIEPTPTVEPRGAAP
jgi:serine protease Do